MKPRRRPRPHLQIHLPRLGACYALTLIDIFERAIAAIWRAHGGQMTELLELRRTTAEPSPDTELDSTTALTWRRAAADESPECEWVIDGDANAPDDTPF
jgi:hypothetical protein